MPTSSAQMPRPWSKTRRMQPTRRYYIVVLPDKHGAKANDLLQYSELEKLIQELLNCDPPDGCSRDRPPRIQISLAKLKKKFGRNV